MAVVSGPASVVDASGVDGFLRRGVGAVHHQIAGGEYSAECEEEEQPHAV